MRDADGEDRELVQAVKRNEQHQHRHDVGGRQHRGDRSRRDDGIAPRLGELLARDDPRAFEDHQQDRHQESGAEPEQEAGDEVQIVADARQRFLLNAADVALDS